MCAAVLALPPVVVRPAAAQEQSLTLPPQTARVGELTAVPIVISPPLDQIPRNWEPIADPQWYVPAAHPNDLQKYLEGAGLAAADVRAIRETATPIDGGVTIVRPPADLLRRLPPDVRATLYLPLMRDERNRAQFQAYRYAGDTVEEWLGHAPISGETRRLVEPLVYRHLGFLYFADIDLIRSELEDGELQRLVKGLLRHATVLLRLSTMDEARLTEVVEYWGRGGRRTDIRPLIESISETGEQVDVSHLLPPLAREHLYRYPRIRGADLDRPSLNNCFWTALNFFSAEPDDRYLDWRLVFYRRKDL